MVLWMLRAISVGCLTAIAALVADVANREAGRARRWTWLAALMLSVALPVAFPVVAPRVVAGVPALGIPTTLRPSDRIPIVYIERASTSTIAMVIWVASSVGLLLLFTWAHHRARRATSGDTATVAGTTVLVSEQLGPAVVGIITPRIILPRWTLNAAASEQSLIVRHETEHVSARDTLLLMLSAVAVIAMPWNPLVWWQSRRLRRAVETDCDARVLASGCDLREYGATLIAMAARTSCLTPTIPMLGGTRRLLEQRIRDMTAPRPERRLYRLPLLAAVASFLMLGSAAVALPSGPIVTGRELVVVRTTDATPRRSARASLVLLDGRTSSYEEIRAVARAGKLGPLKIIMPEPAVRLYGERAVTGALIANTK